MISKVNWLPIEGDGATTWYTVDRPVYVALTIPDDAGTGVVQEMSETIAKAARRLSRSAGSGVPWTARSPVAPSG